MQDANKHSKTCFPSSRRYFKTIRLWCLKCTVTAKSLLSVDSECPKPFIFAKASRETTDGRKRAEEAPVNIPCYRPSVPSVGMRDACWRPFLLSTTFFRKIDQRGRPIYKGISLRGAKVRATLVMRSLLTYENLRGRPESL